MIGIHLSSVDGHRRPSSAFQSFPMPEVQLSQCCPSSEIPGILCFKIVGIPIKACAAQLSFNVFPLLTNIGTINRLTLVFHHYRARTYIYTHLVPSLADIGDSSADAGTISSHFLNKMNDNARSNPESSFIFLMTLHTIFVVFYYYITFFHSMLHEHIRISLNIIYSIINSCHITYLHC